MEPEGRNALERIVGPSSLALISLAIFLLAWIMPPHLYSGYMNEPDLMFIDPETGIYYFLCVACFVGGVAAVEYLFPLRPRVNVKLKLGVSPALFILAPVMVAMGFTIASCVLTVREYPEIIFAVVSGSGEAIKNSPLLLHAPLGLANTWLLGTLVWAIWRREQVPIGPTGRRTVWSIIGVAFLLCLAAATLKVSRFEVMLPIVCVAVTYAAKVGPGVRISRLQVAIFLMLLFVCMMLIFVLFAAIRGGDAQTFLANVVGYTLASYNRMAAVVHGRIRYEYGGRGTYLINCLGFNNMLNHVIPFARVLRWPEYRDWWQSEFTTVADAGLNGSYIWSGAFGYIFGDLGWLSPLWLFGQGALFGYLWTAMRRGAAAGILLYPWAAASILFWFTTNSFVENDLTVFLLEALMFACYEKLLSTRLQRESVASQGATP